MSSGCLHFWHAINREYIDDLRDMLIICEQQCIINGNDISRDDMMGG